MIILNTHTDDTQTLTIRCGIGTLAAVIMLIACGLFASLGKNPSIFEQWLHAAYGYEINGKVYNARWVEKTPAARTPATPAENESQESQSQ